MFPEGLENTPLFLTSILYDDSSESAAKEHQNNVFYQSIEIWVGIRIGDRDKPNILLPLD